MQLILASQSVARRVLLVGAGLNFEIIPSTIDETRLQNQITDPQTLAETLAQQKAEDVGQDHPQSWVIGADQVLECAGRIYTKPKTIHDAKAQLLSLRGKTHRLTSAVAIYGQGELNWTYRADAHLTMRAFSDAFLEAYLSKCEETVLSSVGGYQLEGLGAQLFDKIEGDYFTILGLPLLAVLDRLRMLNLIES